MFIYSTFLSLQDFYRHTYKKIYYVIWGSEKKKIKDPIMEFYSSHKLRFETYLLKSIKTNQNINPIFYNKDFFQDLIKQENNSLELEWKNRVIIENTPRHGNIIMFYDPFKQGFSYYSDTTGIPYYILNAIAMNYVIKFSCLDFFIDNQIAEKWTSPFIVLHHTEEKKEDFLKSTKRVNLDGAPFAKFKNYNTVLSNAVIKEPSLKQGFIYFIIRMFTKPFFYIRQKIQYLFHKKIKKEETKNIENQKKELYYNRFIRLGKINNYCILQIKKKENALNGFHSKLLDGINSESKLQNTVLNYAEYKKKLITKG